MTPVDERQTNRLLGYPDDARLLIINADDFGMCHASTEAPLRALRDGIATSTTLMTPCPWAPHAMRALREHPDIPFGVHLTLVSEFANYRWGPLSARVTVPSLIDATGSFNPNDRIPDLLAGARLDDVEREFRAQIETVLAASLSPTHLDWHCIADGGREDIFDLTFRLAREYGLAMRIHDRSHAAACQRMGLPATDHNVLDSYHLGAVDKSARFAQLLRELPVGLSEWAVHPSLGDAEAQALEPENWRIRRADLDFLVSDEARALLDEEGIVLLDFRALQRVWAAAP
jgi:chitin disaccharide deacetylase